MTKLFDDNVEETPEVVEIPADAPLKPFLDKYKDDLGIAKALLEKDRFIKQLQTETAGLRSELTTRSSVEEALDKLLATNKPQSTPAATDPAGNAQANASSVNGLTIEEVQRLLEEKEAKTRESANLALAKAKLAEVFGASWQQELIKKGKEIGESAEFFEALAKKNPNALLAIVGKPVTPPSTPSLTQGSVNTTQQALNGMQGNVRNKTYYDNLKKTMKPAEFFSPKVQNQLHQDALKLGNAFFT